MEVLVDRLFRHGLVCSMQQTPSNTTTTAFRKTMNIFATNKRLGPTSWGLAVSCDSRIAFPVTPGTLRSIAEDAGAQDFEEFCKWIGRNK